ncbi:MAG: serine/threonine protein phosphatase [Planctomycetes bacterium]|nr:serine/threonine protein phosphatase [Planctomycetota bacterium]
MKILSFGDIHEELETAKLMKDELMNADLIIITGDLTNCQGRNEARKVIEWFKEFNQNVLAQFGNMDLPEVNDYLNEMNMNLHGNGHIIDGIGIFGVGGSNLTPFQTPTEFGESEIEAFLHNGYEKVKEARWKIMVPHSPPYGTKIDEIGNGAHVGSTSVREFILKHKPDISVCGHIHEAIGTQKLGSTLLFNSGLYRDGGYVQIEKLSDQLVAELKMVK